MDLTELLSPPRTSSAGPVRDSPPSTRAGEPSTYETALRQAVDADAPPPPETSATSRRTKSAPTTGGSVREGELPIAETDAEHGTGDVSVPATSIPVAIVPDLDSLPDGTSEDPSIVVVDSGVAVAEVAASTLESAASTPEGAAPPRIENVASPVDFAQETSAVEGSSPATLQVVTNTGRRNAPQHTTPPDVDTPEVIQAESSGDGATPRVPRSLVVGEAEPEVPAPVNAAETVPDLTPSSVHPVAQSHTLEVESASAESQPTDNNSAAPPTPTGSAEPKPAEVNSAELGTPTAAPTGRALEAREAETHATDVPPNTSPGPEITIPAPKTPAKESAAERVGRARSSNLVPTDAAPTATTNPTVLVPETDRPVQHEVAPNGNESIPDPVPAISPSNSGVATVAVTSDESPAPRVLPTATAEPIVTPASETSPSAVDAESSETLARFDNAKRVADAVVRAATTGPRELRIRLNPPELGTLQVEIRQRDGGIVARLQVDNSTAQRAVLDQLPALSEQLSGRGHQVERIDVQLVESDDRVRHDRSTRAERESDQRNEQQRRERRNTRDEQQQRERDRGNSEDEDVDAKD